MEVKAPDNYDKKTKALKVFLAGAIDMGKAVNWQEDISKHFKDNDNILLLNPRRDDWDDSWEQVMENDQFRGQVEWELNSLDDSDVIVLVLTKDSKAPISLLEMGLHASSNKMIVFCEEGFYRKGNVDIVCNKYNIEQTDSLDGLKEYLDDKIDKRKNVNEMLKRFS